MPHHIRQRKTMQTTKAASPIYILVAAAKHFHPHKERKNKPVHNKYPIFDLLLNKGRGSVRATNFCHVESALLEDFASTSQQPEADAEAKTQQPSKPAGR